MPRYRVIFAGLLFLAPTPGAAQATAQGSAKPDAPGTIVVTGKIPDADKKVCKTDVATGSIMPKRICRTRGDWEAIRARSIANLERMKADQQARSHTREILENR